MRYTTEEHRADLEAWPEMRPCVVRPTYEEASAAAHDWAETFAVAMGKALGTADYEWIHHPHREGSNDPLEAFGSWGVRWNG